MNPTQRALIRIAFKTIRYGLSVNPNSRYLGIVELCLKRAFSRLLADYGGLQGRVSLEDYEKLGADMKAEAARLTPAKAPVEPCYQTQSYHLPEKY